MLCGRPQSRDGVVRRAIANDCDDAPLGQSKLHSESGRKPKNESAVGDDALGTLMTPTFCVRGQDDLSDNFL